MPTSTTNPERPSTLQGDYNPAEYSAEYKLLYLQSLVADRAFEDITAFLETLGTTFVTNRYMALYMLTIPVIGYIERNGLKLTAAKAVRKLKSATPVKVIMAYGVVRAFFAAFNISFGGVAGFVRPIITPMAVGSVEKDGETIEEKDLEDIKGMGAAIEGQAAKLQAQTEA